MILITNNITQVEITDIKHGNYTNIGWFCLTQLNYGELNI